MPNWKLATRISIRLAALAGLWCYVASAAAQAPVEQSNTDPNGVDIITGQFLAFTTDISIGPAGPQGLQFARPSWETDYDNWTTYLAPDGNGGFLRRLRRDARSRDRHHNQWRLQRRERPGNRRDVHEQRSRLHIDDAGGCAVRLRVRVPNGILLAGAVGPSLYDHVSERRNHEDQLPGNLKPLLQRRLTVSTDLARPIGHQQLRVPAALRLQPGHGAAGCRRLRRGRCLAAGRTRHCDQQRGRILCPDCRRLRGCRVVAARGLRLVDGTSASARRAQVIRNFPAAAAVRTITVYNGPEAGTRLEAVLQRRQSNRRHSTTGNPNTSQGTCGSTTCQTSSDLRRERKSGLDQERGRHHDVRLWRSDNHDHGRARPIRP